MSYEIVSRLRLEKNENGWYAVIKSCSNNVYPHWHEEWTYGKDKCLTKEQLQAEILLDFYHGNLKGAKNTKYGKFMTFLGMTGRMWGANNEKSRACRTYHFYNNLLYNVLKYGDERRGKIGARADREVKRYLLKEFNEFSDTCKPTIIRLWYYNNYNKNYEPLEKYIYTYKRTRKYMNFTNSYERATKFTSKLRLDMIKRACERNGYKAEFIQV
jgi:hypothetical protein